MKELFALTILELINIGFRTEYGQNPDYISLENEKGNRIYVSNNGVLVGISVFKVSARCYHTQITTVTELKDARDTIKDKLQLK